MLRKKSVVATPPQMNDVYLVEYPKSGITWLSTILANMALQDSGMANFAVTFSNLRFIIPDIHHGTEIGQPIYSSPPLRFIKSHSLFEQRYRYSVYLARHPISVSSSYYRYLTNRSRIDISFGDFVRDKRFGVQSWCEHVDSWLSGPPKGGVLHLLRYEDLSEDPLKTVKRLCENLGWVVEDEAIKTVLAKSSIGEMKRTERIFTDHDTRYAPGFVKGGALDISAPDN